MVVNIPLNWALHVKWNAVSSTAPPPPTVYFHNADSIPISNLASSPPPPPKKKKKKKKKKKHFECNIEFHIKSNIGVRHLIGVLSEELIL